MPAFLLSLTLCLSAAATTPSPLLARLRFRTCEEALSPAREDVLRNWFRAHAGDVYTYLNAFREPDEDAGGQRAFSIDETLEQLAEQPPGRAGHRPIAVQRWQLEMGAELAGTTAPRGLVPTLLGDRLRFDVASRTLRGGEFVVGIHWEPPADARTVARLHDLIELTHGRRAFAHLPLRVIQSEDGDHGEVYLLLDDPADAQTRFLGTLAFVRELSRGLFASANH